MRIFLLRKEKANFFRFFLCCRAKSGFRPVAAIADRRDETSKFLSKRKGKLCLFVSISTMDYQKASRVVPIGDIHSMIKRVS